MIFTAQYGRLLLHEATALSSFSPVGCRKSTVCLWPNAEHSPLLFISDRITFLRWCERRRKRRCWRAWRRCGSGRKLATRCPASWRWRDARVRAAASALVATKGHRCGAALNFKCALTKLRVRQGQREAGSVQSCHWVSNGARGCEATRAARNTQTMMG